MFRNFDVGMMMRLMIRTKGSSRRRARRTLDINEGLFVIRLSGACL